NLGQRSRTAADYADCADSIRVIRRLSLDKWPEVSNAFEVFETENGLNEFCGLWCAENRRYQVTSFCNYLFARHRIFNRPANVLHVIRQFLSIHQHNLHDSLSSWQPFLEFFVWNQL